MAKNPWTRDKKKQRGEKFSIWFQLHIEPSTYSLFVASSQSISPQIAVDVESLTLFITGSHSRIFSRPAMALCAQTFRHPRGTCLPHSGTVNRDRR